MGQDVAQRVLIQCMSELGYEVDEQGMCYGISAMAEQALFVGELDKFLERIQNIERYAKDFKSYMDTLNPQDKSDLLAFFDGVALAQQPWVYDGSQTKPNTPLIFDREINVDSYESQQTRYAADLTQPVLLRDKIHRMVFVHEQTGQQYFSRRLACIARHAGTQPIALTLDAAAHTMTILYDPERSICMLMDPNHMPREISLQELDEIAKITFESGAVDEDGITITLNSCGSEAQLHHMVEKIHDDPDWTLLDKITDVVITIQENPANFFLISHELQNDIDFICAACFNSPTLMGLLDEAVVIQVIQRHPYLFQKLPEKLQGDPDFSIKVIRQNPTLLIMATSDMKNHPEVVLAAFQQDKKSLYFAENDAIRALLERLEVDYADLGTHQVRHFQDFKPEPSLTEEQMIQLKHMMLKLNNAMIKSNPTEIGNLFSQICHKAANHGKNNADVLRSFKTLFQGLIGKMPQPTPDAVQHLIRLLSQKEHAQLRKALGIDISDASPKIIRASIQEKIDTILKAGNIEPRPTDRTSLPSSSRLSK